jgi:hypothetical protein
MAIDKANLPKAAAFGAASITLYAILFLYSDELVEWARLTRQGDKIYFVIPIVIAFVFSYVHGAFTGYFWDVLGLKPAQKKNNKKK